MASIGLAWVCGSSGAGTGADAGVAEGAGVGGSTAAGAVATGVVVMSGAIGGVWSVE